MKLENQLFKIISKIIYCFLLVIFFQKSVYAISENEIFITDVTPVSFSVIWATTEAATGNIEVFSDVLGTTPVQSANITLQYTDSLNAQLANQAALNGILRARISNLIPDTPYFFKLTITPTATNIPETYPASGPLLGLKTQSISSAISNESVVVTVVTADGVSPATSAVFIARVANSPYPVSKMVGDGIADNLAMVNLTNVYGNDLINRELAGGESLELIVIGGSLGRVRSSQTVPINNKQGELKTILPSALQLQSIIDSDGDGLPDWYEIENGLSISVNDADIDTDGDGLNNIIEYQIGSDLNIRDTDQDGWEDGQEVNTEGTSAILADTDQDGINDSQEAASGTDPLNHDTDGDGFTDGFELDALTDPTNASSFPIIDRDKDTIGDRIDNCLGIANTNQADLDNDGEGDACDNDIDGDGFVNQDDNAPNNVNPGQEDGDIDGIGDLADNCPINYNPEQLDTDSDGVGNSCDSDDDNDGVNDYRPAGVSSDRPFKLTQIISFIGTTLDVNALPEAVITISKSDKTQPEGQRLTRLGTLKLVNFEFIPEVLSPLELATVGDLLITVDAFGPPCNCVRTRDNDTITLMTDQGEVTIHLPASNLFNFPESLYISTDGSSYDAVFIIADQLSTLVKSSQENIPLDNCRIVINTNQSDIDNDGLGDVCDVSDEDIDGDGVLNGSDNCRAIHNVSQLDTDNDALGDACDSDDDNDGLSDANESTIGSNSANADSDSDGVNDNNEDFDFDGVSNQIEIANGRNALIAEGVYSSGLNYFHYPFSVADGTTAFSLLAELGGEINVQKVQRQNTTLNQLETAEYITGSAQGTNFPITSGEGYLLVANQAFNKSFNRPVECTNITLVIGLNIVGLSCLPSGFSAFDALVYLGGEDAVTSIQRLNTQTGLFETAAFWNGSPVGADFPMSNTQSYLVHAKQNQSIVSPINFPVFNITSLTDGAVINTNQVTIAGNILDPTAIVTVNGQLATIENGVFTANLTLEEGDYALNVEVSSQNNLSVNQILNITVEIPPTITINSHTDGESIYQSETVIFGTLDKPVASLTVNGDAAILSGNSFRYGHYCSQTQNSNCDSSNPRLDLVPGNNTVTIQAIGLNGAVATKVITLNRQRLVVNALNPGSVTSTLDVAIPDNIISKIASYTIFPNFQISSPFKGQFIPTANSSQNGFRYLADFNTQIIDSLQGNYDYDFTVAYEDASGEIVFSTRVLSQVNVPLSTQPPLLTIETQSNNDVVNYVSAMVSGDVGISAVSSSVKANNVTGKVFDDLYSAVSVPLPLGVSNLSVVATGENGMVANQSISLDVQPIEFTIAQGQTYRSGFNGAIDLRVPKVISDNINNFTLGRITLINRPLFLETPAVPSYFNLSINDLGSGDYASIKHEFAVSTDGTVVSGVYDMQMRWYYGVINQLLVPLRVTVLESIDPPTISANIIDGSSIPGNNLPITITVNNDSAATVTINGISATQTLPSNLHRYSTVLTLNDGSNVLDVQVVGLNGLTSTATYTITVDPVPAPVLTITSHNEGDILTDYREPVSGISDTVNTTFTMYANGESVDSRWLSATTALPAVTNFSPRLTTAGNQLIEIYATYYATPVTVINLNYVPPPLPEITVTSHTQGQTITSAPVIVEGTVANNFTYIRVDGFPTQVNGNSFSFEHVDLFNGANTITIEAGVDQPPFEPVVYNLELNYQDPLPPINFQLPLGGDSFGANVFYHEFTIPPRLWNLMRTSGSVSLVSSGQSGLDSRFVQITKLSHNRVSLAVPISSDSESTPGTYLTPISVVVNSASTNQPLFKENINTQITIVDELKLAPGGSISQDVNVIQLTPEQDVGTDNLRVTVTNLPSYFSFQNGVPTHVIENNQWLYGYRLLAYEATPLGMHTISPVIDIYANGVIVYTEQPSFTFEVVAPFVAPTVSITSHNDGAVVVSSPVTITGTLADPNAVVSVNGVAAIITPNGANSSFSADVDLVEGVNTIAVQSTGQFGYVSNDQISITLDTSGGSGSSGNDLNLTLAAGSSLPFSFDLFLTAAEFDQVANVSLSSTYSADISFTFDSLSSVSTELKYVVGHTVTASATAAGSYDFIFNYTLKDSALLDIVTVSKTLNITVQ